MKRPFRILILGLSAAAGVIFGLDKVGVTPIAPGYDVGFKARQRDSVTGQDLVLSTDVGDLNCWVQLQLRTAVPSSIGVALANGTNLGVAEAPVTSSLHVVEITDPGRPGVRGAKFEWPAGIPIVVSLAGAGPVAAVVEDWTIYVKDKESDSRAKAEWRREWFWISVGLLMLATVGAVYGAWPARDERKPFTLEVCLEGLITSIESTTRRETRQIQSVLRKVLIEQAGTREALDALGAGFAQSRRLWFTARRNFTDRLQALSDQLAGVQRRLPP